MARRQAYPVARLPGSNAIVWSDGEVTPPSKHWDLDGDEVEPDDPVLLWQVVVVRDFEYVRVELADVEPVTLH